MIIEGIFNLLSGIINLIPFELPSLPSQFQEGLDFIFEGILSSLGLINIFIDLQFWITCAVAMLIIYNIKHIWNTFVFCLNLIPSVNISYWS